jgi:hypothetical protein
MRIGRIVAIPALVALAMTGSAVSVAAVSVAAAHPASVNARSAPIAAPNAHPKWMYNSPTG